jgi:hypothetical protein
MAFSLSPPRTGPGSFHRARRDDRDLPRGNVILLDRAFDPAVVIEMSVGVDHRGHRLVVTGLGAEQRQARLGDVDNGGGVDDDQTVGASTMVRFASLRT